MEAPLKPGDELMTKDRDVELARREAELRFDVVAGLLASPPPSGQLRAAINAQAKKLWKHPRTGGPVRFGASTIERWYYSAQDADDPVGALMRKLRSDAGQERVMSHALLMALKHQYKGHPSWTYQLHHDNLEALVEEDPAKYGTAPSYSTTRRRMLKRGWTKRPHLRKATAGRQRAQQRLEELEVRSFESPYVHAVWHYDFHEAHRKVVDDTGTWRKVKALCILDDCSRLVCHMQWYWGETTENLVHGLTQAISRRGVPRSALHDNGSAMRAAETLGGLSRLGIESAPTLPYSPYQNGKQEVFWGQVEGRLMAMLEGVEHLTLPFLNKATQAWVEGEYNGSTHDELGCSPIDKVLDGASVARPAPSAQTLRLAFCDEVSRTQRCSDGTVSLEGVRFEVPSRLRTLRKVRLRYASWDLSQCWLVDPREGTALARLLPLDKSRNADGRRRALEPLDELPDVDIEDTDPLPPLMRKLLATQAASGLPPAYLPSPQPHQDDTSADTETATGTDTTTEDHDDE